MTSIGLPGDGPLVPVAQNLLRLAALGEWSLISHGWSAPCRGPLEDCLDGEVRVSGGTLKFTFTGRLPDVKKESGMKKFWYVMSRPDQYNEWRCEGSHASHDAAKDNARVRAQQDPKREYVVLEALSITRATQVVTETLT